VAGCCKKNFSHIRFYRHNARWLSLLGDFVITNFGTRAPRARALLEQNSGDATERRDCAPYIWGYGLREVQGGGVKGAGNNSSEEVGIQLVL